MFTEIKCCFLKHNFPLTIQYCSHSLWACGSIWKQRWRTRGWIKLYSLVQSSRSPNTGIFSRLLTWLLDCWEEDALAFPVVCKALKPLPTVLPQPPPSFPPQPCSAAPPPLQAAVAVSLGPLPRSPKASAPLQICHSKFAADYVLPSLGEWWYMICKARYWLPDLVARGSWNELEMNIMPQLIVRIILYLIPHFSVL